LKGKVEGLVGYIRRNFMVPLPRVRSIDEPNVRLLDACEKRKVAVLRRHKEKFFREYSTLT
jgi:transposase